METAPIHGPLLNATAYSSLKHGIKLTNSQIFTLDFKISVTPEGIHYDINSEALTQVLKAGARSKKNSSIRFKV